MRPVPAQSWDGRKLISKEGAQVRAGRVVGDGCKVLWSWPAVVTDEEFAGGLLQSRKCWVVECRGAFRTGLGASELGDVPVLVVIDAVAGNCWEAMTLPKRAWWRRVALRGPMARRSLAMFGELATGPVHAAACPMGTALNASLAEIGLVLHRNETRCPDQVVWRLFAYTGGTALVLDRTDGEECVPQFEDAPTWYVCFDGLEKEYFGFPPPDADVSKLPKTEEIFVEVGARDGTAISWGTYR